MSSQIYRQPVRSYAIAEHRLVAITGLSNPGCCCLHPQLRDFLKQQAVAESGKLYQNFPFTSCLIPSQSPGRRPTPGCGEVPLWSACWSNAQQYGRVFRDPQFLTDAGPHWRSLRLATRNLLVVAGSCGLELVRKMEFSAALPPTANRLRVLALGPVARQPAWLGVTVVQGRRDWISRASIRDADFVVPGVGHMDYWKSSEVREIAKRWLADNISA